MYEDVGNSFKRLEVSTLEFGELWYSEYLLLSEGGYLDQGGLIKRFSVRGEGLQRMSKILCTSITLL